MSHSGLPAHLPPVPSTPPQTYLTLSLRQLGFNTTQSNLLSVPSIALGIVTLLVFCYLSEIIDSRTIAMLTLQVWTLPLLIALYTFDEHTSNWVYYTVVTLITAYPYVHPVQVAWASTNSYSVDGRTVSASLYNMFCQAGGIVSVRRGSSHERFRTNAARRPIYIARTTRFVVIRVFNMVFC